MTPDYVKDFIEKYKLTEGDYLRIKEKTSDLLSKTKEKYRKIALLDGEDDTILFTLEKERDEAHTHSRILFWLMTRPCKQDCSDSFLLLLLKCLGVPENYSAFKWTPYRERYFDDGRIDFVLECPQYVIAIEMKIDAGDQLRQLERYGRFCQSRGKAYTVCYLTLDGHAPSAQSVGEMDAGRLRCISFRKDILGWLEACLSLTEPGGYKYSYIKQYIGTVRRISGCGENGMKMSDTQEIITDYDSALGALFLSLELSEKMTDTLREFLHGLADYLERETHLSFEVDDDLAEQYYLAKKNTYPGIAATIDCAAIGRRTFDFIFYVEVEDYLYAGFAFRKTQEDGSVELYPLADMKKKSAAFYHKCVDPVDELNVQGMKKSVYSLWFPVESTNGKRFDFKNFSDAALRLIDDMDVQVEYVGDYLANQVLRKVLPGMAVK